MLQDNENAQALLSEPRRKGERSTVCGVETQTFLLGVIACAVCATCLVAIGIAIVGLAKLNSLHDIIHDLNGILKDANGELVRVRSDTGSMVENTDVLLEGIP